jgi:predicted transposase/invertase (TIGR01784 family)
MSEHDASYKQFFSHKEMVQDLLTGFVHENWVNELDFSSLEPVKTSFVSDNLRRRDEDIIWRVRWKDNWLYVYILLAFQSTVNPFMAVRVGAYVHLLYQDIIKQEKLGAKDKLPPIFPIILYNGKQSWYAAQNVTDLIVDIPELRQYYPCMHYFLIDEGEFKDLILDDALKNLVSALFRLENSRHHEDIQEVLRYLTTWLHAPQQESLRQIFITWLRRVLLPRHFPEIEVPAFHSLQEMRTMLAGTMQELYDNLAKKAHNSGIQQGEKKGKANTLIDILETKFGQLTQEQKDFIHNLEIVELTDLSKCLWTIETLEDVFK